MDKGERQRLKTLANDAIVDLFGVESREARLAEALEQAVEDLEYHGDCIGPRTEEDEVDPLDADHLRSIHLQLKERLTEVENTVTAIGEALWEDRDAEIDELKEIVKELRKDVNELGDEL